MCVPLGSRAWRSLLVAAGMIGSIVASGCGTDKIAGPAPVASVSVAIASPTLVASPRVGAAGTTTQATASVKDASGNVLTGRAVAWNTDNAQVATVSADGLVAAVQPGSATITATSEGATGHATVTVNPLVPQVRQRSLALGTYHACAIAVDGYTYCWGNGHNGQLGTLAPVSRSPMPIYDDHKFSGLSAARNTTYGVTAAGVLWCWGGVPCDPTARNTIDEYNGPAVVIPKRMSTTRAIEVLGKGLPVGGGYEPMCAVGVGNVAYCWGKNESGQLGIGSSSSETVLAPDRPVVGNHAFADVAGGFDHACAITITGSAYCWGAGMHGALGDGTGTNSPEPRLVAGNQSFKAIGVGGSFACGLSIGGQVYCWGDNRWSQLGTTTSNCLSHSVPCSATPVPVSGGYGFESIAVGFQQACGITSAGDIYCWGRGFGPTPTRFRSIPSDEPGGVRFSIVDIGGDHICAVSVTGDAWCRGGNHLYQLGNGNNEPTDETVMVIGGIKFRTP